MSNRMYEQCIYVNPIHSGPHPFFKPSPVPVIVSSYAGQQGALLKLKRFALSLPFFVHLCGT